jgi:lipopolysaccharide export system protein LptA
MIMEGEAYIDQEGFIIKSEKIHYDLEENKIMKSINSTIESSR